MTPLQSRVKAFIADFIRDEGYSPSLQEIADAFGHKSPSGIRQAIKRLQQEGHLTAEPGRHRSLQLADRTERLISAAERVLDKLAAEQHRLSDLAADAVADLESVLSELRAPEHRTRRPPAIRRRRGSGIIEIGRLRKLR